MSQELDASRWTVAARKSARILARLGTEQKNAALCAMAAALVAGKDEVLCANDGDLRQAQADGVEPSRLDRLRLDSVRIDAMAQGLRDVAALADPVGETLEEWTRTDGLRIVRVRVPFGVVLMIYEARPNVTVDATALAIKTGNAVILRGGREANASNQAIVRVLQQALHSTDVPTESITLITDLRHDLVDSLIRLRDQIDLVIPRGGASLIQRVVSGALVPVLETGVGNCHVYVDQNADPDMAKSIVLNAKTHRPSVCNAAETLILHESFKAEWVVDLCKALIAAGVELRVSRPLLPLLLPLDPDQRHMVKEASEQDYAQEFLDMTLAVVQVESLDAALAHIARYGTKHSEAIITENPQSARVFMESVDAAVVYHNASTRFTDGFEFGFGAEMGISTQKLHARGPMGLPELTTYTYRVYGTGQIRT